MDGHIVGPVSLKSGSAVFPVVVHVVPIYNDMQLGLDFLLQHGLEIILKEFYLLVREDKVKIPLEIENSR